VANEFILPELGENIDSGDVVKILVAVGETLRQDQPVLELETDKATVEVPSTVSGVVKAIHVKEGDQARVGQLILTVEASNGPSEPQAAPSETGPETAPAPAPPSPASPEPTGPVEFKLPELGENIEGGDVVKILVAVGDTLQEDQPVLELETDKATIEVPATVSGVVTAIHLKAGDQARVGQTILTVSGAAQPVPATPAPAAPAPKPAVAAAPQPAGPGQLAPAAPSVRRLARELGVDINLVPGSGPAKRISQTDVKNYVKSLNLAAKAAPGAGAGQAGAAPAQPTLPDFSKWGDIERERMSAIRRATARNLAQSWSQIVHVTHFDKADITELEQLRKQYGKKAEAAGGKLTITAILLKVLAAALKRFPKFNASLDLTAEEVIYKKYYHIGIAVDTDRGLVVPSIRNVDQKSIIALAAELTEISVKARNRKLTLEEMQGSTFTITNLGGIGGTNFTPIVNYPEVAILAVARGGLEPVYQDGAFVPRLMMPLGLSYDHRLIDGADAARFLRWVCEALEEPFLLALEG
jgi:pyruvate dehydrogenase E2 component (dihydrolipoamide acetyltransferase)